MAISNSAVKALVDRVLLWCGSHAIGQTPNVDAETLGESEFKDMLTEWDADRTLALKVRETKDILAGVSSVLIANTLPADWDTTRPTDLLVCQFKDGDGYTRPLHVMSEAEYRQLTDKVTDGTPTAIWYNQDEVAPCLYLDKPTNVTGTLVCTFIKPLYDSVNSKVSTSAGAKYWAAFNLNLRLRLDAYFEKKAQQIDYQLAENAKQIIRRLNAGAAPRLAPTQTEVLG